MDHKPEIFGQYMTPRRYETPLKYAFLGTSLATMRHHAAGNGNSADVRLRTLNTGMSFGIIILFKLQIGDIKVITAI